MPHQHRATGRKQQQGAILFISLIILLLITIVAIGSTRLSTLGQRISLSYQLKNSSFQAADSALTETQTLLANNSYISEQAIDAAYEATGSVTDSQTGLTINSTSTTVGLGPVLGTSAGVGNMVIQRYRTRTNTTVTDMNITTELEAGFMKPQLAN